MTRLSCRECEKGQFIDRYSLGGHLWYQLMDSIGMSLIRKEEEAGRLIGLFKGIRTAYAMLAVPRRPVHA